MNAGLMPHDDAALAWVIRLREGGDEDWAEFTEWLEADPANAAAYDEAAMLDDALAGLPRQDADDTSASSPRRPLLRRFTVLAASGMAAAAALVAVTVLPRTQAPYAIESAPGETRTVTLADGSRIDLNGAAKVVLARSDPRFVRLEHGEALFTVVHDDDHPFRVEAAGAVIEDLGTVFNVEARGGHVDVGVSEGEVRFRSGRQFVDLTPGMVLAQAGNRVTVSKRAVESIGSWREGRLQYSSAPFDRIAHDLGKAVGFEVAVDPSLRGRQFTGILSTAGSDADLRARIAATLDIEVQTKKGGGWILTARTP